MCIYMYSHIYLSMYNYILYTYILPIVIMMNNLFILSSDCFNPKNTVAKCTKFK